ncbi:MAG: S1C family serine protease [Nanoarchaeota archaeon]
MLPPKRWMVGRDRDTDRSMLERFVQNLYWAQDMPVADAKRSLEQGLLTVHERLPPRDGLTMVGQGNGLLITDDGYFLTAAHCLATSLGARVRTSAGIWYDVLPGRVNYGSEDLVLAKADIPKRPAARVYRLGLDGCLKEGAVEVVSRKDSGVRRKYGVLNPSGLGGSYVRWSEGGLEEFPNHFSLLYPGQRGDSGSIVVDPQAYLLGFISGGNEELRTGTACRTSAALNLVHAYLRMLRS